MPLADLIGAPFKLGARGENGYYDCYGLCIEVARRHGKRLDDLGVTDGDLARADEYAPAISNARRIDAPKAGAVLEMETDRGLHLGICLDEKTFIHATEKQGVRISRIGAYPIIGLYELED